MSRRWLKRACQVYLAIVIVETFFSIAAFAGTHLPATMFRHYELALERAENVATLGALMSACIGIMMCAGCLWSKIEPPDILVRCTLIAIIVCTCTLLFLPAIVAA